VGKFVEIDSLQSHKLQKTTWFIICLFFGKRSRANQHLLKKQMLLSRKTSTGEKYFEVSRERGAVFATKNHQEGLENKEDESSGKMFERPGSNRCLVRLIEKYLSHLNPECSSLFQKPRAASNSFHPANHEVWYYASPFGHHTLANMLRRMSSRAGIKPH